MTTYHDGSVVAGTLTGSVPASIFNSSEPFIIGRYDNDAYADGQIDEVGIWSRALSSTEVTKLYNGGAGLQYPFFPFSPFPSHYNT
jgi:hypothetical protein